MASLELKNLVKRVGNHTLIDGLNLQVADGELLVIVGPSGCGKTTLLRMIAGLESVTSGDITLDQQSLSRCPPGERNVAMVFQNYALYPHMSVFDNIAYSLKIKRVAKAEINERVQKVASSLQLTHLLTRKPAALSGGQRQRVAMGRAIIRQPKLFLFDEPLSNLDANLRVDLRQEIYRIVKSFATTSIYVTHDQSEAMTLADRILILNNGKPEQLGRPMDIYHRPASRFVAGFIGSPAMNFIHPPAGERPGQIIGIRAEDIQVGVADGLDFRVEHVDALGSETLLYGRLKQTQESLTMKISPKHEIEAGREIKISFHEQHLHYFSEQTGERIT